MIDRALTFRALAHPVRLQLLSLLTGAAMSAAEAAREVGLSQANASYHLRLLERAGLVEVSELVEVRGGRARRYRHVRSSGPQGTGSPGGTPDSTAAAAAGVREAEEEFVRLVAVELRRRHARRVEGPRLGVDADLWVDPQLWQQVVDRVAEASAALHAAAVPPRSPGAVRVSMSAALFPVRGG